MHFPHLEEYVIHTRRHTAINIEQLPSALLAVGDRSGASTCGARLSVEDARERFLLAVLILQKPLRSALHTRCDHMHIKGIV